MTGLRSACIRRDVIGFHDGVEGGGCFDGLDSPVRAKTVYVDWATPCSVLVADISLIVGRSVKDIKGRQS